MNVRHPIPTCNNNNTTSSWKKLSEDQISQTAQVMDTSLWPPLSLSSPKSLSFEVQLEEPPSKKTTIETISLPVAADSESTPAGSGFTSPSASEIAATATLSSSDNESSTLNWTISVSGSVSVDGGSVDDGGSVSGSLQRQKVVFLPSSNHSRSASSNHPSRSVNQNHQHYQSPHFGRGSGFNFRGGNSGRGDGWRNQNYSNRRHQPRPFNDRNSNRGFSNVRAVNSQRQPHGFVNDPNRFLEPPQPQPFPHFHPHSTAIAPSPPFTNVPLPSPYPVSGYMMPPFGYYSHYYFPDESPSFFCAPAPAPMHMEVMGGHPLYPQPYPVYNLPDPEVNLCNELLIQIEYYFSDENLMKDYYLRDNMNDQGWVPVRLIAGFKRVKSKTSDINLILRALQPSGVVEVQGDKIRKRGDWRTWILQHRSSSTKHAHSSPDILLTSIENIQLDATSGAEMLTESKAVSGSDTSNDLNQENPNTNTV